MASGYTAGQWIDMVWLLLSDNTLPAQYSASTASDVHATNNCVQQPPTHTRARKIGYRNSARFQATPGNKSTATGSAEHAREYLRRP